MSNSTHRVNVVRINEILPHTNADTLGIVQIGGYQVVVKKENYKVGDLALYVQPDTVVPVHPAFEFLWEGAEPTERRRRITVRRFRKEWSEGLLIPVSDFTALYNQAGVFCQDEGDDVAKLLGFTHYEEPDPTIVLGTPGRKLTFWQRFLRLFGIQPRQYGPKKGPGVYGMDSIKNYPRVFVEGEPVIATEKIHGSNARYYFEGKQFWVGSHKKWWKDKTNIWWRVAQKHSWIEAFCREFPKHTLRGEVTPTQGDYYKYGVHAEEQFFGFDVQRPDGSYWDKVALYKCRLLYKLVPVVYQGPYDAAKIKALAEGNSLADGAKHIREGLVISPEKERAARGLGRVQLKLKSMTFFEKEGKA